jgi:hypothetical protein
MAAEAAIASRPNIAQNVKSARSWNLSVFFLSISSPHKIHIGLWLVFVKYIFYSDCLKPNINNLAFEFIQFCATYVSGLLSVKACVVTITYTGLMSPFPY